MSPKFIVHATGSRGEVVVKRVLSLVPAKDVLEIVTARDPGSFDDKSAEIQIAAQAAGVPCRDHRSPPRREIEPGIWRILAGWRQMVEPTPTTIVFHDSLLPLYRGFSPVVATLIEGTHKLGATAFFATERFDEGDIIAQLSYDYSNEKPMRIAEAFRIVSFLYADLASEIVTTLQAGKDLPRRPQDDLRATYTPWRDSIDYFLDWRLDAWRLWRTVYALGWPYVGAKICARMSDGMRFRATVREATIVQDVKFIGPRPIGKLFRKDGGARVVVCGEGMLRLDVLEWHDGIPGLIPGIGDAFRVRFLLPEECLR